MVATRESPGVKGTIAAALFLSLAGSLGLSQRGADTAQAPAFRMREMEQDLVVVQRQAVLADEVRVEAPDARGMSAQ